jgi:hypothetical protein
MVWFPLEMRVLVEALVTTAEGKIALREQLGVAEWLPVRAQKSTMPVTIPTDPPPSTKTLPLVRSCPD